MRLIAATALLLLAAAPGRAQTAPHTFLLGAWTGGMFPAPTVISAQQCLAQPSVIFTRDVVMRATFTDVFYIQRLIQTTRGVGNGIEFRFSPAGRTSAPAVPGFAEGDGFGCDNPNDLHVQRISPNEIRFPGCKDFPFPLVRCPAG